MCSIMQATTTNALSLKKETAEVPLLCVQLHMFRSETDLAFKINGPDGVACIAEM